MGLVCQWVFEPVIRLIRFVVSVVEFVLVQICRLIQELVNVLTYVLKWVCQTVVRTVCDAVCGVVCGICDFFCGIFGCDCGCRNICNNVCKTVTDLVCGWTYVLEGVLQNVTRLVCDYVLRAIITVLHVVEAFVEMVLTWVCTLIDIFVRGLLCWTYLAEIFSGRKQRRFRVAPKIVRDSEGHSDWFVYVNNADDSGNVDQVVQGYILGDEGRPLVPVVHELSKGIAYYEVATRGDRILGTLRRVEGEYVPGRPFLYYPYKVLEIASHLFGDIFAGDPADDGRGTEAEKNLLTYTPNVQAWLQGNGTLPRNNYNNWGSKYTGPGTGHYFGDRSLVDIGLRVDRDATCSRPTNTFLHLLRGDIGYTPGNTGVAEEMTCPGLALDATDFLLLNKDSDGSAVTTYFVSEYEAGETEVGCNVWLGYTVLTFQQSGVRLFAGTKVLEFEADTNAMMARIVDNVSGANQDIVRVAETYLHELGHQCGLLHDEDDPDCHDDQTLNITLLMHPGENVRRALTRFDWCMIRLSRYVTGRSLTPFTKAPELPDSGSVPPPVPAPPTGGTA